ncbi:MAG: aldo/keto reductase [Gemmatimonadetes bacterium]|nr:aldo/keto reductase [Gemmatimonadota bacterium]MYB98703.1 aldo/keto reductase [Gemmatimonadota bacterium]MYI46884.1 aldo/keto reductase [Gemmatimonadota bacterium]
MTADSIRGLLAPGLEISRVVTGLWQVADQERGGVPLDPAAASRAMDRYADLGLSTFDMADHYGSAEVIAGALAARRDDVRFLTKWVPEPGAAGAEKVAVAVDRARTRLGTECIDLLQFHAWNYADPSWLDCLFELAEHQAAGRIRHLGLTNCDAVHLDMAVRSGVPIVSNQVCFSLLDRRAAGAMTEVCRQHGIALLAYGTLAGGFLSERWLGRPEPPIDESLTWSQMKYRRFIDEAGGWDRFQGLLEVVARVAGRLGGNNPDVTLGLAEREVDHPDVTLGLANVACRYVLEQRAVAGIIVGARLGERSHVEENLNLFRFSLDDEARRELDDACAALDPIPGDCGDEYRRPPFLTASGDLSHHLTHLPAPYPVQRSGTNRLVSTGTPWEEMAGYSRAVRSDGRIHVAGTTASHGNRVIGGRDPAAQTHFIVDKIEGALQSLGAALDDVVRTRVYIREGVDWEAVARAHGVRFGRIRPANTMVYANTIGEDLLVEIEVEAEAG